MAFTLIKNIVLNESHQKMVVSQLSLIKSKMVERTIAAMFRNVSTARVPVRRLLSKYLEVLLLVRDSEQY
ncbi:Uncharacterised protein [Salmonella enterica subsp. enterica serovar Typhimurium]|nr:Uncharacterised protein [Salmonella enterica subsp. enterica serovar Typhimurium]